MNCFTKKIMSTLAVAAAMSCAAASWADPLPGRDELKFSQLPQDGMPIIAPNGTVQLFYGHDELSTAYSQITPNGQSPYRGTFMADDFADKFSSPVLHVKWWGSYIDNFIAPGMPVDKFLISFESDQPVGPGVPFSHPAQPLLTQVVNRAPLSVGSGSFTEKLVSAGGPPLNENLYEYNAELHLGQEFFQQPDTVYWLKIAALVDLPAGTSLPNPNQPTANVTRWGWHNRDYSIQNVLASTPPAVAPGEHISGFVGPAASPTPVWHFQDDAVTGQMTYDPTGVVPFIQTGYQPTNYIPGVDLPPNTTQLFSKDLAFQLFTTRVPEPATALLLLGGCLGLACIRRR